MSYPKPCRGCGTEIRLVVKNPVGGLPEPEHDEADCLQAELETARRQFSLAQKCINQIDDFLEYRWRAHSSESVRETVIGMIAEYGHDVAPEPSGEAVESGASPTKDNANDRPG